MAVIELVDRDPAAKGLDSGPVQSTTRKRHRSGLGFLTGAGATAPSALPRSP